MASKLTLFFTLAWALLPLILFLFPLLIESRSTPTSHLSDKVPHHHRRQPFEFIKKLEGSQKGETIKGIHQLKQYLEKFGYLPLHSNTTATEGTNDDSFDDLLETAIKSYQHNFHLNISGQLDAATAKRMMIPRCGVADIVNEKSGKGRHLSSTLLHSISHYSFFQYSKRWPPSKTHLTYGFLNGVQVMDMRNLSSIISSAFAKWQAVTNLTMKETQNIKSADIKIGFFSRSHGVLARAYIPTVGVVHFDANERWAINPSSNELFDVETVAVHEIGHLLGLDHSNDPNARIYPTVHGGQRKVELGADDIQGIRTLYGL
ncbi:hypothetical protein AAC387_Pa10g1312 [Persea americana]